LLIGFQKQGNLGLGYLASTLRRHGYDVRVLDVEAEPRTILEVAQSLDPVLIGFSLIFQFYIRQYGTLVRLLRENGVTCHFTMGGHFPSLSYEQTLALVPELDSVVRFEGELTLLELVDCLSTGREWHAIQGIAYREDEHAITTPFGLAGRPRTELPHPPRVQARDLGHTLLPRCPAGAALALFLL
jgi:radical SAM superfamily enzyme YgiQ (UPF0313 family)